MSGHFDDFAPVRYVQEHQHLTIDGLIEILQDARQQLGGDAEVRLATQPSWPLESRVSDRTATAEGVLFLAESQQLGYLAGDVAEQLGWSA